MQENKTLSLILPPIMSRIILSGLFISSKKFWIRHPFLLKSYLLMTDQRTRPI